ncbi:alveolin domain containing intermediate filament imc7 [Cystoisospora suis]|uniref:Alveolin domain containing intermediate filament imc7 n=1 Tax=Cystoisospora suis TaxID=483139 RepID=A0A2C6LAA7_9APIC|nr:alveolin domain containing intermediate filament imc7 [Cystoisospora suis]
MSFSVSDKPMEEMCGGAPFSKEGEEGTVSNANECESEVVAGAEGVMVTSYDNEGEEGAASGHLPDSSNSGAFEGTEGGSVPGDKQNPFNCTRVLVKPPPSLQSSGGNQKGAEAAQEGGKAIGSDEEALLVGSEAMEIQKLLEQQSPATAKRLILSATTQTTTSTRATTTTTTSSATAMKTKHLSHTPGSSPGASAVLGYQDPYADYYQSFKSTEIRQTHIAATMGTATEIETGTGEVVMVQSGAGPCCYTSDISNGAASTSLGKDVTEKFHGNNLGNYEAKVKTNENTQVAGSVAGGVLSAAAHFVKSLGGAWPQATTNNFPNHCAKGFPAQAEAGSEEVARFIPSAKVIDLPLDVVYSVPDVQTRIVNYTFECPAPGYTRLVPKVFPVDTPFIEPRFEDVNVPVVMSETFVPELQETSKVVQVPVARYVPKVVPVDVYVPRPFAIPIKPVGCRRVTKKATITPELYHQIADEMNPHLAALAQFNAKQRQVHNEVVEKSRELAARINTPPPAPTRVECRDAASGGPCFDDNGARLVHVPTDGKDMRVLEKCFNRLKNDIRTDKGGVEQCELTEDVILSVYRGLGGGRLEKFSSGSVGIPMVFRSPDTPQKLPPTMMTPAPQLPLSTPVVFQFLTDHDNNNSTIHHTSRDSSVLAGGEDETTMIDNRPDTTPMPSPIASES